MHDELGDSACIEKRPVQRSSNPVYPAVFRNHAAHDRGRAPQHPGRYQA